MTKLVLISPDGFASPAVTNERSDTAATVKLMRYVLPKSLLRLNLEAAYGDPSALTKETLDRYYDLILAPGVRDAMIARMDQTQHEDPRPLLQRIRVPVLLIWGEKDALIPFSNAADYTAVLVDSTLASFPGLGHVPQEEAPTQSVAPVRAFLAR